MNYEQAYNKVIAVILDEDSGTTIETLEEIQKTHKQVSAKKQKEEKEQAEESQFDLDIAEMAREKRLIK